MQKSRTTRVLNNMAAALCAVSSAVPAPAVAQDKPETALTGSAHQPHAPLVPKVHLNIPAQNLSAALTQFARDTGTEIVFSPEVVRAKKAAAIQGEFVREQALGLLLKDSGLTYRVTSQGAIVVEPLQSSADTPQPTDSRWARLEAEGQAQATAGSVARSADSPARTDTRTAGIPEVLVEGSRILNMDIKRSRDDAQPYVIFERETIERSAATNLEDFFRRTLTMSTLGRSNAQDPSMGRGVQSEINLRGLGANQTLILVDGRRVTGGNNLGTPSQSDINGIPLAAIERIEVLPTTASGIYGGSATGGVINIVMRRDYSGVEATVTYGNTFDSDAATRRVDLAGGATFEDGKTNILVTASFADSNELAVKDRQLMQRGRAAILANNPGFYLDSERPPLGATTNIRSADGSPLFGPGTANITFVPEGYAGNGGLAPLLANAGRYNFALSNTSQLGGPGGRESLVAVPTVKSGSVTLRREFTPNLQFFIEAAGTESKSYFTQTSASGFFEIDASAPNNPFGRNIIVNAPIDLPGQRAVSDSGTSRLAAGMIVKLPHQWTAGADYTMSTSKWSYSYPALVLADEAISSGELDVLRDLDSYPLDLSGYLGPPLVSSIRPFRTRLRNVSVRASGPALELPAGPVVISGLLEHRKEEFLKGTASEFGQPVIYPSRSQSVSSVYAEMQIPLLSARDKTSQDAILDMQVAVRHDRYTTNSVTGFLYDPAAPVTRVTKEARSTDPTVGLRYHPFPGLMLRASYGTGFLPPTVSQLVSSPANETVSPGTGGFFDPRRGGENMFSVIATRGGNPDLEPEDSASASVGVVLSPESLRGLRLSLDYTRIRKTDNITKMTVQTIIDNEALLPGRVVRANPAPGDPFGVGRIVSVDATLANITSAEVEAFDLAANYTLQTATLGSFEFSVGATRQTHLKQQLTVGAAAREYVGITSSNPLAMKGNASLVWNKGDWTLGWSARYYDSYLVADPASPSSGTVFQNQGSRTVPSQTFHDLFATYELNIAWLGHTEIRLGVDNVFNEEPALDLGNEALPYSPFGDPRLAYYYLSVKTGF